MAPDVPCPVPSRLDVWTRAAVAEGSGVSWCGAYSVAQVNGAPMRVGTQPPFAHFAGPITATHHPSSPAALQPLALARFVASRVAYIGEAYSDNARRAVSAALTLSRSLGLPASEAADLRRVLEAAEAAAADPSTSSASADAQHLAVLRSFLSQRATALPFAVDTRSSTLRSLASLLEACLPLVAREQQSAVVGGGGGGG